MKLNLFICDRCGEKIEVPVGTENGLEVVTYTGTGENRELCVRCHAEFTATKKALENEAQSAWEAFWGNK